MVLLLVGRAEQDRGRRDAQGAGAGDGAQLAAEQLAHQVLGVDAELAELPHAPDGAQGRGEDVVPRGLDLVAPQDLAGEVRDGRGVERPGRGEDGTHGGVVDQVGPVQTDRGLLGLAALRDGRHLVVHVGHVQAPRGAVGGRGTAGGRRAGGGRGPVGAGRVGGMPSRGWSDPVR